MRVYCVMEIINKPDNSGNIMRLEAIYEQYQDALERVEKLNQAGRTFISQGWETK